MLFSPGTSSLLAPAATIHPLSSKTSRVIASNDGTPMCRTMGNLAEVRAEKASGLPQVLHPGTATIGLDQVFAPGGGGGLSCAL